LLGLVVLAGVLAYAGRGAIFAALAGFLDISTPPEPTDYVLILGGGRDTRPFVAAALWHKGYTQQILIPTARVSDEAARDGEIAEHEIDRKVLQMRGVPAAAIVLLPGPVATTADEASALATFLEDHPQSTVTVVTTNLHTRRARWIFARTLGDRARQLRFVAAPTEGFGATTWWHYEEGWASYSIEYVKLGFYWVRY
jgi:uncharacterized SAM-binding protein YcdF (DUF218 family)